MITAYLALGSNLGDSVRHIQQAKLDIAALAQTRLLAASSLYQSKPMDAAGDDYINAVIKIETGLNVYALLAKLQQLESRAGRPSPSERLHLHHAPRTLDIDILFYGKARVDSQTLVIPHPRLWSRAFVVLPLAQVAPELVSVQAQNAVAGQAIRRLRDGGGGGVSRGLGDHHPE